MFHFDLKNLILTTGYLGIFGIIFAESGLLLGFFLPGDSLMLTAGLLASQGYLDIKLLVIGGIVAAILGDSTGYWFGKKTGPRIFKKEDSLLFHKKNIIKANEFYQKHGGKTIILARFMPFIRTFAPIVAGVGTMNYRSFISYNVLGGIFWVLTTSLAGYLLGNTIPNIDRYFLFIIAAVILISALPGIYHFWKEYRQPLWKALRKRIGKFS
jgi:membrane-associated protein